MIKLLNCLLNNHYEHFQISSASIMLNFNQLNLLINIQQFH